MSQADLQNGLSPAVQQLAKENTGAGLSTQARLDQQNTIAKRNLINYGQPDKRRQLCGYAAGEPESG